MSTAKKPFSAEAMLLDGDAESEDLDGEEKGTVRQTLDKQRAEVKQYVVRRGALHCHHSLSFPLMLCRA